MGTITVTNLGKAYKPYPNRWSRLAEWVLPSHKPRHTLKWVMQDVSFNVNPGEAVGIIGINGAGKSPLLVVDRSRAQDVKHVYASLKAQGYDAHKLHRTVHRPWGTYTVLEEGAELQDQAHRGQARCQPQPANAPSSQRALGCGQRHHQGHQGHQWRS